jgi:chitinase
VDGSAGAGGDYVAATETVTIPAGETAAVVRVATRDDAAIEPDETVGVRLVEAVGAEVAVDEARGVVTSADVPTLAVGDAAVAEGDRAAVATGGLGPLSTAGNRIVDENGEAVTLAGVNWFGMETERFAPDGLHLRNWQEMMGQMAELGFNTIRLPFSNAALDVGRMPVDIDYDLNPDLAGLTALEILDEIVAHADTLGLRILLDNHRSTAGDGPEANGLWYTADYGEARWLDDWRMLAERYADAPAVIGADLRNEPHGASWGEGGADWAAAAERAGNAILATGSEWLIVVEGVQAYQGDDYWWGGNLQGVADRPVELDRADKLVYSAHAYSPEVYEQPWFAEPDYPANLPAIWDENFGYIHREGIAPVLVGEFGNRYEEVRDRQWLDAFAAYLAGDFDIDGRSDLRAGETGLSWTYWAWNPNSGDTGGILADDWRTPVQAKLDALAELRAAGTDFDPTAGPGAVEVAERGLAEVVVSFDEPAVEAVTAAWGTEDGTAVAGEDYEAAAGVVRFAPGETEKTVTVKVLGDDAAEGDETFALRFDDVVGAARDGGGATVTILDDDAPAPEPDPEPAPEADPEPTRPADDGDDAASPAPAPSDPTGDGIAAVEVSVEVQVSDWWYQLDVTLTNTAERAVTDWTVTLPAVTPPEQLWNAFVVDDGAAGTTFASDRSWATSLAPGQSIGFGMGGDPGGVDTTSLDADALSGSAEVDGIFV